MINDTPIPAALRGCISSVTFQDGLKGADRVDLVLVNDYLRWLDHPLLALGNKVTLLLGYAPDPLEQMFVGEIVSHDATFPGSGAPTLTVAAQDFLQRTMTGTKARWFGFSTPAGNFPLPDPAVVELISGENGLIALVEPIGAALASVLGGAELLAAGKDKKDRQKLIRKQQTETDFQFVSRIAKENGWDILIDHRGPLGGHQLRFQSQLDRLAPDVTLRYGQSLIEFTPRISTVGQIVAVSVNIWIAQIKTSFKVTAGWDWDRMSLSLDIQPAVNLLGTGATETKSASIMLIEEPLTLGSAPRVLLSRLIPRLNERLTGSGSTIGEPRLVAGTVLRLEGLGVQFGGLYRVTGTRHTIDSSGYRTSFDVRKDIWFGSIPLPEQGAVPLHVTAGGGRNVNAGTA